MKNLIFAIVASAAIVVVADGDTAKCNADAAQCEVASSGGKNDEAIRKERIEKLKAARYASDKKKAEEQGMTIEEYRAKRKAKVDAYMAKVFGMTDEEYAKLTDEERMAKFKEIRAKRIAERKAKKEAKQGK